MNASTAPEPWHRAASSSEVPALGELRQLSADPSVTDILVAGRNVAIDRGGGLEPVSLQLADPERTARELLAAGGRHVDEITPIADVRLGRARVHAVLPPIATRGAVISIRLSPDTLPRLSELAEGGFARERDLDRLVAAVRARDSVLISGGTGSGKTTLLQALLAEVSELERIVVVEEVSELRGTQAQFVSLEARQANIEGAGRVWLDELVRAALRMRPDWLVVGECRGSELPHFLSALNTGHAGAGTIHANQLADVPARLEALGALAGLGAESVARLAASGIRLLAHVRREDGVRRLAGLAELQLDAGRLSVAPC